MIFLLSIMLTAQSAPVASEEIPRMEQMIEITAAVPASSPTDPGIPAELCTKDKRWCVFISRDVDLNTTTLNVYNGQLPPIIKDGRSYARDVGTYGFNSMGAGDNENASVKIWSTIIRMPTLRFEGPKLNETIVIGVEASISGAYSGGGANSTSLRLYTLSPNLNNSMPEPSNFGIVLDVPLSATKFIRACFGDKDYQQRRGMCHDDYGFAATIKLGKTMPDGKPQLLYQSVATATPGGSNLSNDNAQRKLSRADLKPRRDRKCSYRRTYIFNGEFGMYFAAKPVPDCSDFVVP